MAEAAHSPKLLCIHCFASQEILAVSLGEAEPVLFFIPDELIGLKEEQQVSSEQFALVPPILIPGNVHFPVQL